MALCGPDASSGRRNMRTVEIGFFGFWLVVSTRPSFLKFAGVHTRAAREGLLEVLLRPCSQIIPVLLELQDEDHLHHLLHRPEGRQGHGG